MWHIKSFANRKEMVAWLESQKGKIQWSEVFVNNGYAVEYRPLHKVY